MKSKQIIILVVIVIVLAGAGVFAYKAFMGAGSKTSTSSGKDSNVSGAILPHGNSLDFDNVKKFNKNDKLFPYPTVNPTDVGQPLNGLVKL